MRTLEGKYSVFH